MSAPSLPAKITPKAIVITLVIVAVVVAWLLVYFLPASHKLDNLEVQRTTLQSTVVADQARLRQVKDEAAHVTQIKAMYERLQGYAPSTAEVYTYIHTISAAASSAGVTITSLNPSSLVAVTGTSYSAVPITASIKGTYDHLLAFLKGLYALPRLTDVNNVSVGGGGPTTNRDSVLTVSLQLTIFTSPSSSQPSGAGT